LSLAFTSQPTYDDLVGALSIIIYTLFLMVSIKYMFIVLSADDDGEGGTFALYSLLARYAHIVRRDPNLAGTVKMDRHLTNDLKPMNNGIRTFIENSRTARVALKILGVLGVSMVMAYVEITPLSVPYTDILLGMVFSPQHNLCWVLFKASKSYTQISQALQS
jgi:KUP system potassium uptake protein